MAASSDEKSAAMGAKDAHQNVSEDSAQEGTKGQTEAAPVVPQDGNSGSQDDQHCEISVLSVSAQGGVKGKSEDFAQYGAAPVAEKPAVPTDGAAAKEVAAEVSEGQVDSAASQVSVHNPHFAAVVRNPTFNEGEVMAKATEDVDKAGYLGEVIAGLRINDPAAKLNQALAVPLFDETRVPLEPFYRSDNVIAMAFHLGLRWYIRPGNFLGLKSGETDWNDANLRYLAYVCNIREVWPDTPHSRTTPLRYEAVFGWGPFANSVIILHGSGRPVLEHHVAAFNQYLDNVVASKGVASKKGFKKYWTGYKRGLGNRYSNMPSPYASEEQDHKDKLGVFDPDFVKLQIAAKITDVWVAILDNLNNSDRRKIAEVQAEAERLELELLQIGLNAARSIVYPEGLF